MNALALTKKSLQTHFDNGLVNELLEAYQESKHEFQIGGLRLNAVEGDRFCEAAFRLLEQATTGVFTPLGRELEVEKLVTKLANTIRGSWPDSIRLHIPLN